MRRYKLRKRYGHAGRAGTVDKHMVEELDLYAENEHALYAQKEAILAYVRNKLETGKYDHARAPKLWGYWVKAAADRYSKEFPGIVINKATRDALAQELADRYRNGEE